MLAISLGAARNAAAQAPAISAPPAPSCSVEAARSLGRSTWRRHALALGSSPTAALAIVLPERLRAEVIPIAASGAIGATQSVALTDGEQLVDVLPVSGAFLLRTVAVCPDTGRLFHKCMTLRVFGAEGRLRGVPLVEDVVEWGGVGRAIVVASRVVMVRTPMYDRGGVPSVATYEVSTSGVVRVGVVRAIGDAPRPNAQMVGVASGADWAAVLWSEITDEPPVLISDDGARLRSLRGLPSELRMNGLYLDEGGYLLFYDGGDSRVPAAVRITDDARATLGRPRGLRGAPLPTPIAQRTNAEVRAHRGHLWLQRRDAAGTRIGSELDLGEALAARRSTVTPIVIETPAGWLVAWSGRASPTTPPTTATANGREAFVRQVRCAAAR